MKITPQLWNDTAIFITLVITGTAAIVALLKLAEFSERDKATFRNAWFQGGMFCVLIYFPLAWRFSLNSPALVFLLILIVGALSFLRLGPNYEDFRRWIPYLVWVYFWSAGLIGWRAGWVGVLLVTLPTILAFGLGLFVVSGFLLPFPKPNIERRNLPKPPTEGIVIPEFKYELYDFWALISYPENKKARQQWFEQQRKALRSLISYTLGTNYAYYVVVDEKFNRRTEGDRTWLTAEEKLIERSGGDVFREFMAGPGIILTGCDHAVAISTGTTFKGVRGPGVIFTGMSERPAQVIDLRVQLRAFPVEARTKDGIDINVFTFTPFQIGTGKEIPTLGKGFPYRASDVFKAIHAQQVVHYKNPSQMPEDLQKHTWYDLPRVAGKRIMHEIISRYTFDELYAPFELYADTNQDPRSRIGTELKEELERVLPEWGIQRIGSGISNLMPADERVLDQRIEAWQADWARRITLRQAAGQSRRLHLVEQARAQAQIDIILSISEQMEQLRGAGADAIARHFIEVLEDLIEKSTLGRLPSQGTNNVIQRARR
ncbi:MAG: SPFH domain-containing protein, partial [Chloroflexota bacterium]|nr:SPFH domain-containing protein [Chloroflexota bacterium]